MQLQIQLHMQMRLLPPKSQLLLNSRPRSHSKLRNNRRPQQLQQSRTNSHNNKQLKLRGKPLSAKLKKRLNVSHNNRPRRLVRQQRQLAF